MIAAKMSAPGSGDLLRAGVCIAALVVSLGGIVHLVRHGAEEPHYSVFNRGASA